MIAIVDYGMANLRSVEKALARVGGDPVITRDPQVVAAADKVVLPGVGAFCAAMTNLERSGLRNAVRQAIDAGKPFLGICLGLQLLFEESTEMGVTPGLGVLPGRVVGFFEDGRTPEAEGLKVPHIGWNSLRPRGGARLFHGLEEGAYVYFVHSYYPVPCDAGLIAATSDYGGAFCCAVERGNLAATQFHPEKSGAVGLQILRNFVSWD
ncbi:MAG TPA: imidazole glycerol phosphate synthase subunit HisH [Chthonomonadaceae bacterium]|jgi:glutamine amidotransferase|nr:imidazole glycerol phosphate synthase subunit HisH [Chthonomonadaceae bacterium]